MTAKFNAYDKITNQIIEALEQGEIPWEKPWNTAATAPQSVHGKAYRGFNSMWLGFVAARLGYSDPRWITYNQAKKQGGTVRKGQKSQAVTLWMQSYNHQSSCPVKKSNQPCKNISKAKCQRFMFMRYYSVFNVEQVDGLELKPLETGTLNDFDPIEAAMEVVDDYREREGVSINWKGDAAYYSPDLDEVTVPAMETFRSIESYYSTVFHELAHSTGHKSRLNRKDNKQVVKFGDPIYAQEELVAEITNAFVGGVTGVTSEVEADQRVAYIQSWLKALRNDTKMVVVAAGQAQKAADLILNKEVK
tara:strand:+ start:158 stop:1072 length:915 start_codon:yes stop_codon:yes gene_type:complete